MPKEWIVSEPPTGASSPYYLAVSFDQERLARQAYDQAQALLFKEACELSAFRFYVGPTWYVAIIGETPLSHLETQLKHLLRRGKATTLPSGVIDELLQRRSKATSTSDVDCSGDDERLEGERWPTPEAIQVHAQGVGGELGLDPSDQAPERLG